MSKNDIGLEGIEFVEFTSPNPKALDELFTKFGFKRFKKHSSKQITRYIQEDINILINLDQKSFAASFQSAHGPSLPSMGWRVKDAKKALELAVKRGATAANVGDYSIDGKPLLAINGIGGSLIYFVDQHKNSQFYEKLGFTVPEEHKEFKGHVGFKVIDHLTNNVPKGELKKWSDFYKNIFGFEEVRYFDIKGVKTGLISFALRSPCGSFCIPINEGTEAKSQINEYLEDYKGPGVQHLAFLTEDMVTTVAKVKQDGIETLDIDDEYYAEVFDRVKQVSEDHEKIKKLNILVDGDKDGYLLQIFTKNVIGPIFIEIIQRKNYYAFGEGNFGALFRSIEKDQEKRGFL